MGNGGVGSSEHPPLLTAVNARSQVHLIVGCNPLASARCTRALEVGANPVVVSPAAESMPPAVVQKVEEGKVQWIQREFRDEDLQTLGREEIDNFVDAVFVTLGHQDPLSTLLNMFFPPPLFSTANSDS